MILNIEDRVVFEDNHLLILNKLPGEIVQGDKTGDEPLVETLKRFLKTKYNKPGNVFLGLTHRLDRPTSGLVIFAKTSKALTRCTIMFSEKKIKKSYLAVVKQKPKSQLGTLENYLLKNEKLNKSFVVDKDRKGAKLANLTYKFINSSDNYQLLEIDLKTGRHHQIRAQLSKIGWPIKGDLKYGFNRPNKDGSIHLHAFKIKFEHPVSKEQIKLTAVPAHKDPIWSFFINSGMSAS